MIVVFLEAILLVVLTVLAVIFKGGTLWILWILAFADFSLLVFYIFKKLKKQKNKETDNNQPLHIDDTFEMTGSQFEDFVAKIYVGLGFKLVAVKKSRDQGIDIIVRRFFKTGLQAKCYDRPVGVRAVQEAAAGKKFYGLKRVAVVTNSIFTASARSLAKKNRVMLIDRKALAKMIKKAVGLQP